MHFFLCTLLLMLIIESVLPFHFKVSQFIFNTKCPQSVIAELQVHTLTKSMSAVCFPPPPHQYHCLANFSKRLFLRSSKIREGGICFKASWKGSYLRYQASKYPNWENKLAFNTRALLISSELGNQFANWLHY